LPEKTASRQARITPHFVIAVWRAKAAQSPRLKRYWEIIADNLKKAGWSYGYVSALDREGRTIWIADGHLRRRKTFRGGLEIIGQKKLA
jgi:hypothetical protein